jgi:hypothetical protein
MLAGTEVLQVQGDARPGNSGGPVLGKEDGKIVGILTMGTDDTNNYLRPANDVKMLLNTENKLGQVDLEWKTGLAMFQENHYSEAMKHFDAVLNLSAGHLLAQEYKAKAQANMGNDVPFAAPVETAATGGKAATGGLPVWAIIVIAAAGFLVIALIAVIIIVVMRRRTPVVQPGQPVIGQPPAPPQIPEESTGDVKKNFCPSCGSHVQEDAAFCPNCGKNLAE